MIACNINTSIDSVLLPAMSNEQDNKERVRAMTRRSINTSIYIMAPLMMGLCFVAPEFVRLVFTEKWMPCVPFLRICCVNYMFYPIHTANLNAIKAMGRSDLFLKLEIVKKVVGIIMLVSTMWFGVMAMAYSLLITNIAGQIINSWPNRKLLNYKYIQQVKDIMPSILLASLMGICVSVIPMFQLSDAITLLIQIITGAAIYIGISFAFKLEPFQYMLNLLKPMVFKRK